MNGHGFQTTTGAAIAAAAVLTLSAVSQAMATTAYVEVTGKDSATCGATPTAPCKTIAAALASAAKGGGFERVVIVGPGVFVESVSLTAAGTEIVGDGGVFQAIAPGSGGPAITVNVGATNEVRISNVQFLGSSGAVAIGLSVVSAQHVDLDHVQFHGFGAAAISYTLSQNNNPELSLASTIVEGGACILIQPTSPNAAVVIDKSAVYNCSTAGLNADASKTPGGSNTAVLIKDSDFHQSGVADVAVLSTGGSGFMQVTLRGTALWNANAGVFPSGPQSNVTLDRTTIEWNGTGVNAAGGANINSYGNNDISQNGTNLAAGVTLTPIVLQ
jgi:hypothetical protein